MRARIFARFPARSPTTAFSCASAILRVFASQSQTECNYSPPGMEITFEQRFRGPLTSANGGYACGRIADYVEADAVEVTLRLPPPLERPLAVRPDADGVWRFDGDAVVAEARPADLGVEPSVSVSRDEAEVASARHVHAGSLERWGAVRRYGVAGGVRTAARSTRERRCSRRTASSSPSLARSGSRRANAGLARAADRHPRRMRGRSQR